MPCLMPGRKLRLLREDAASSTMGGAMVVSFTTCPFEVTAGNGGGIVIEDRKTGRSWRLTNWQTREFVRLIGRQRRTAEHLAETQAPDCGIT